MRVFVFLVKSLLKILIYHHAPHQHPPSLYDIKIRSFCELKLNESRFVFKYLHMLHQGGVDNVFQFIPVRFALYEYIATGPIPTYAPLHVIAVEGNQSVRYSTRIVLPLRSTAQTKL